MTCSLPVTVSLVPIRGVMNRFGYLVLVVNACTLYEGRYTTSGTRTKSTHKIPSSSNFQYIDIYNFVSTQIPQCILNKFTILYSLIFTERIVVIENNRKTNTVNNWKHPTKQSNSNRVFFTLKWDCIENKTFFKTQQSSKACGCF